MIVRGGVRRERQLALIGGRVPQGVEDAAGLDGAEPLLRVDTDDMMQVLGEVHHDSDVAALPGEAGAAAARQHRGTELAGRGHGRNHVVDGPGTTTPIGVCR